MKKKHGSETRRPQHSDSGLPFNQTGPSPTLASHGNSVHTRSVIVLQSLLPRDISHCSPVLRVTQTRSSVRRSSMGKSGVDI